MHTERDMAVIPSEAPLGAEIVGVDLRQELSERTLRMIDTAYNTHTVVVFRDQQLTPEHLLRFASHFGSLEISPRTQFLLPA